MADLDDVRDDFVRLWTQMGAFWGVSPAAARVYGWLISQADPVDAEALQEGLGISRGAVSLACKELQDWGLVHPERAGGTRRLLYRAETDLERVVRNVVQTRKRREWDPILENVRAWIPKLKKQRSQEAAVFRERLEAIEALVGMADGMAEKFLGGGVVQKLGLKLLISRAQRKGKR